MDYSLYLVTDRRFIGKQTLAEAVEQAILGGCTMVQLREKELSSLDFYWQAIKIKHIKEQSLIQKQPSKSEGCFCIYARKA